MREYINCCPFCGSDEVEICRTNKQACWVRCANCGADAPSHRYRKKAIFTWNQRFNNTQSAKIVDDQDAEHSGKL